METHVGLSSSWSSKAKEKKYVTYILSEIEVLGIYNLGFVEKQGGY